MANKGILVTKEQLETFSLTPEEKEKILSTPYIGHNVLRSQDLNSHIVVDNSKQFDLHGDEVGEINHQSCLYKTIKKNEIIISFNNAYMSFLNRKKVFIHQETVYANIQELIDAKILVEGESMFVKVLAQVRQSKSTERPGERFYKETTFEVKLHFLYEIKDEKLIQKYHRNKIITLKDRVKQNLYNQDNAVDQIFDSIKIYATGLKEKNKPIGSYLLVGPTGTGKTELATLYAKELDCPLIRLDMSEFSEKHTVSRLIGSPAGYVGYGDPTIFEKEIGDDGRKLVLLLDEMEKSHQELQTILLQAMDNSRITLSNGSEVNFENVLIIMTSNLGTVTKNSIGLGNEESKVLTVDFSVIKNYFLPEFLGRLSGVVQFNPLKEEHMFLIVDKFIASFNQNQMSAKGAKIIVSDNAKSQLIKIGFDQQYGARPLKKALHNHIYNKIADLYLYSDEESKVIEVDYKDSNFVVAFNMTNKPQEQQSQDQIVLKDPDASFKEKALSFLKKQ